jgi:hypothetical protein
MDGDIAAKKQQILEVHQAYNEWSHRVHEDLNGYANDAIKNFVAYLRNIENGFGKHNDETNFQNHSQRDVTGQWFKEAQIGAELLSQSSRIHKEIIVLQKERELLVKQNRLVKKVKQINT